MINTKAFIFDLNGTMIDDMEYHVRAWYDILNNDLDAGLSVEAVRAQMYGKNKELLERVFGKNHFTEDQIRELSVEKERRYQKAFRPELRLIPGLDVFLENAAHIEIPMAIGTAAIPFNVDFVLDNLHIRNYFKAIVSADDVARSKPDPETFLMCAELLHVPAQDCIVFEDAPKGVEAAANAGMKSIVLATMHTIDEFADNNNILCFIKDYVALTPLKIVNPELKNSNENV